MLMRVAVVGAGWAGCAAALQAAERGAEVVLLEAARCYQDLLEYSAKLQSESRELVLQHW